MQQLARPHVIEAPRAEGVLGTQQHVKVVRPEVVPNEAEYRDPHVCPHPVPLQRASSGMVCQNLLQARSLLCIIFGQAQRK